MKKYKLIILDADDTLLDYRLDEKRAFQTLFDENGISYTDETLEACHSISKAVWAEVGLNDVHLSTIRLVWHDLYKTHVTKLFQKVFEKLSIFGKEPAYFAARFLVLLREEGHLLPTVQETLKGLKEKGYRLAVLTNGISAIQRGRLRGVEKYFDKIFVSQEQGLMKPEKALFERVLTEFSVQRQECLMVGDSLLSDMAGASSVGIDTCFLNRRGEKTDCRLTYTIASFQQLLSFL